MADVERWGLVTADDEDDMLFIARRKIGMVDITLWNEGSCLTYA
jgi:hypothetical protein